MRRIEYDGNEFLLKIDDEIYVMHFCIGIYAGIGIEDLGEVPGFLRKAGGVFKGALAVFNENIKRYNREYNGREKPIRYRELAELCDSYEMLYRLGMWLKEVYINSQMPKESAGAEPVQAGMRPTAARLITLGTSVLGLSYAEVCGLSLKEMYRLLEAYNDMHKLPKNDENSGRRAVNEGDLEAFEKMLGRR